MPSPIQAEFLHPKQLRNHGQRRHAELARPCTSDVFALRGTGGSVCGHQLICSPTVEAVGVRESGDGSLGCDRWSVRSVFADALIGSSTRQGGHGCTPGSSAITEAMAASIHIPVLRNEVLEYLQPRPGQIVVDGTLGGGGHARALAERVAPDGFVLALDRDPHALEAAERTLAGLPIKVAQANFCDLPEVLRSLQLSAVDGVLLDVGLSSDQLADATRGFSFDARGALDLRFDPTEGEPAWQLLANVSIAGCLRW